MLGNLLDELNYELYNLLDIDEKLNKTREILKRNNLTYELMVGIKGSKELIIIDLGNLAYVIESTKEHSYVMFVDLDEIIDYLTLADLFSKSSALTLEHDYKFLTYDIFKKYFYNNKLTNNFDNSYLNIFDLYKANGVKISKRIKK